jgi:hypothetical protein
MANDFDITSELNIEELEDPIFIDIDEINRDAECNSITLCNNLEKIYGNREFMDAHPDYKKRLDIEVESLRVLIKMKIADEHVHDVAVKAIAANPSNASMYTSMIKVQASILDIQKRMDEVVKNINNLLKGYQTELNFDDNSTQDFHPENDNPNIQRGTRAFIREMNKDMSAQPQAI